MSVRLLLQAVDQASLVIDNDDDWIRMGRGVLVYLSFLGDGSSSGELPSSLMEKAARVLLDTSIFTHFCPERMVQGPRALRDFPTIDLMVIPQASMNATVVEGRMSTHDFLNNTDWEESYVSFCHHLRVARGVDEKTVDANGAPLGGQSFDDDEWVKHAGRVLSGTFGYNQGLKMESGGPFTHVLDVTL